MLRRFSYWSGWLRQGQFAILSWSSPEDPLAAGSKCCKEIEVSFSPLVANALSRLVFKRFLAMAICHYEPRPQIGRLGTEDDLEIPQTKEALRRRTIRGSGA